MYSFSLLMIWDGLIPKPFPAYNLLSRTSKNKNFDKTHNEKHRYAVFLWHILNPLNVGLLTILVADFNKRDYKNKHWDYTFFLILISKFN
jgi:hypothetical protein